MDPELLTWHEAISLDELAQAEPTGVRVGTTMVVLVRLGETVHATEALCPHKFAPLAEGDVDAATGCLHCPVHDAAFHLESGAPRDGDGWAGRLKTFPARVEGGRVFVALS